MELCEYCIYCDVKNTIGPKNDGETLVHVDEENIALYKTIWRNFLHISYIL